MTGLDWVIYGGESGTHFRPEDKQWALDIFAGCREADVACFHKQSAHRFTDRLNWNLVNGVALVDNDTDLGPYGSMWLKHVIDLRGGVTADYIAKQVDAFIASMEMVRRMHEAEPDSPLADGEWMGRG